MRIREQAWISAESKGSLARWKMERSRREEEGFGELAYRLRPRWSGGHVNVTSILASIPLHRL